VPRPNAQDTVFRTLQPAIRFTKDECLDLPSVLYTTREVELTAQQKKYYAQLKKESYIEASGQDITVVNAGVMMTKLLQVSAGSIYSDKQEVVEFDVSNRMTVLKEIILEASHKVIVFAPFRHSIDKIMTELNKDKITCEAINGDVSMHKRTDIFKRFQETPNPRVLVIQPQAASHGVTLHAANVAVFWSPVMSVETYIQCCARIDRAGQKNHMTIVHIQGSAVEKRIYHMLQNKIDIHTKLVDLYREELEL
jgi:SNF2 family DNA or RNA helicase